MSKLSAEHAARLGFVAGALPGRMVLPASQPGAAPVLVLQYETQAALSEDPDQTALKEFSLTLDVPHVARAFTGGDHRLLLPICAILGPALLMLADTGGRLMVSPSELQAGIMTALCGAPALIVVARRVAGPLG